MPPIQGLGSSRSAPLPTRLLGLLVLTATIGSLVGGGAFGHLLPTRPGPGDVSTPLASATAPRSPGPGSEARAGTDLGVGPAGSAPPQWINVTPTGMGSSPPAAASAVMAYDPDSHATIFFGGCAQSQCPGNQTWAYANGTWSNLTDRKSAPPARYGAVMDYDRNMPGLLLFGGHSAGSTYLNDTWLFQNGDWTNLTRISPTAPAPREYASMAFDPDPEENGSVLFGGHVYNYGPSSDTWIWEGWSGWVFLNTSAPPPVSEYASMAYDPLLHAIVLYGCGDGCVTGDNWTWELYSGQWWQVSASPPAGGVRIGSVMTWDPALSAVLLFGGYSTSYLGDSWTFAGAGWTQLPKLSTDPGGRYVPSMSSDSTGSPPLLFGGSTFYPFGLNPLNDTWVFEVPPTVALSTPAAAEASAPVNLTVSVSNGTAPYRVLFDYGDGAH
ncbi:MAG TPA: hypothetical protein VGS23_09980, partial [Thermoplasmata archaeon]|nr:hypothetical protein [Thermoplasmata archaeon]